MSKCITRTEPRANSPPRIRRENSLSCRRENIPSALLLAPFDNAPQESGAVIEQKVILLLRRGFKAASLPLHSLVHRCSEHVVGDSGRPRTGVHVPVQVGKADRLPEPVTSILRLFIMLLFAKHAALFAQYTGNHCYYPVYEGRQLW